MDNDQDEVVVDEIEEETDEEGNDKTDWKAIALKHQGIAKRLKTKIEKSKVDAKVEKKVEKVLEEKGLDRVDKAILRVEKITSSKEIELVEDWKKETGKDVDERTDQVRVHYPARICGAGRVPAVDRILAPRIFVELAGLLVFGDGFLDAGFFPASGVLGGFVLPLLDQRRVLDDARDGVDWRLRSTGVYFVHLFPDR